MRCYSALRWTASLKIGDETEPQGRICIVGIRLDEANRCRAEAIRSNRRTASNLIGAAGVIPFRDKAKGDFPEQRR